MIDTKLNNDINGLINIVSETEYRDVYLTLCNAHDHSRCTVVGVDMILELAYEELNDRNPKWKNKLSELIEYAQTL